LPTVSEQADGDPAARFAAAWDSFVLALRRGQARGQQVSEELTLAQYYMLVPLEDGGALPVSRLAEFAGVAAPTCTRMIDSLERVGAVVRGRTDDDRRTVLVSLTPAGRELLERKRSELGRRRRALYERLEHDEREPSERLLRHLAELISQL
jgi:MarR family transcriptional regulator, organic hydroperoxide resistance regulator